MVRDYAKRVPQKPKRRKKFTFLAIILIVIAIGIPATFYFFKYQHISRQASISTAVQKTKPVALKPSGQKFDFYTLLPKMKVQVPQNAGNDLTKGHFILQVAAFQNEKQADTLKTRLISLGYVATIDTYQSNSGTVWNRVIAGPFGTMDEAEKVQSMLHEQGFESILLKARQ